MNKAFVREPDEPADLHCPRCGALGQAVSGATIAAQLRAQVNSPLGSSACFCATPSCEVAYFDHSQSTILIEQLRLPIYPKDPDAPICACFGLKAKDVVADARLGNPAGVRMLLERSVTQREKCVTKAADGRCCVDAVQRLYLRTVNEGR